MKLITPTLRRPDFSASRGWCVAAIWCALSAQPVMALSATEESCLSVNLRGLSDDVTEILTAAQEDARSATSDRGSAMAELGMHLQALELPEQAVPCFEAAQWYAIGDYRWPYLAAVAQVAAGDVEGAENSFLRALHAAPDNAPARVRFAELLRADDRLDQATVVLSPLFGTSNDSGVLAALGEHAMALENFELALQLIEAALEASPDANRLHYLIGQAHRGLGNDEQAREHLAKSGTIGVRPVDLAMDEMLKRAAGDTVYLLRGRKALGAGDLDAARAAFAKALDRNPENLAAQVNLAVAQSMAGMLDEAAAGFEAVLDKHPDNTASRYNLAALMEEGDPEAAYENYAQLIGTDAEDDELHMRMGRVAAALGNLESSREHFEMARRDNDRFEEATLALAQLHVAGDQESAAIQLLKDSLLIRPSSGPFHLQLADLLSSASDTSLRDGPLAAQLAERVHQYDPTEASARVAALAHAEMGECSSAREWLGLAIELTEDEVARSRMSQFYANFPTENCRP